MLCRHVVFPARDTGANPAKIAELRHRVGADRRPRGRARLFITRPTAGRRRLLNESRIAARLEKRGFVALDPGTLSFDQQVAAFSDAALVVGAHGAALTNAAFMAPGGGVVELTHTARVVWTFHEVACASGLAYACVIGARASETDNPLFVDFSVDPDAVDAAVDAALQATGT
jgi:capsular polysaccharide biosynthesis protein